MAEMEEFDRLSNLPDDLLSHILSFLSTKEAITTSILSKRWEYVWTKVPVIDFTKDQRSSMVSFKAFVDRALHLNDAPELRLFRFDCNEEIEEWHLYSWIRSVMRRHVLEMVLSYRTSEKKMPYAGILKSDRLATLKLNAKRFSKSEFHMPNLSILHLKRIEFTDDASLENLLSGLPRLSELVICKCVFVSPSLCVSSSSLKRLVMKNVITVMKKRENATTILEAPHLRYLSISDVVSFYKFTEMPSLDEARICVLNRTSGDYVEVVKLLKYISCSKSLIFGNHTVRLLEGSTFVHQLPLFPNLTSLDVNLYDSKRDFIFGLLECVPGLLTLKITVCSFTHPVKPLPCSAPLCLRSTLKDVSFEYFQGSLAEEKLVQYFLANAKVLKVMSIHVPNRYKKGGIDSVTRLLKMDLSECEFRVRCS